MEERLLQLLSDVFETDAEEITFDSSPENIALWDSLNHLKMVAAIETAFQVKFTMKEIRSMMTVSRVRDVLEHHLDGNRSRIDDVRQG